jgi:hypothetical protein
MYSILDESKFFHLKDHHIAVANTLTQFAVLKFQIEVFLEVLKSDSLSQKYNCQKSVIILLLVCKFKATSNKLSDEDSQSAEDQNIIHLNLKTILRRKSALTNVVLADHLNIINNRLFISSFVKALQISL